MLEKHKKFASLVNLNFRLEKVKIPKHPGRYLTYSKVTGCLRRVVSLLSATDTLEWVIHREEGKKRDHSVL